MAPGGPGATALAVLSVLILFVLLRTPLLPRKEWLQHEFDLMENDGAPNGFDRHIQP